MATQQDDVINVQRGNQAGVGGDDTYILSPALIDADAAITISDTQGANKIQLIGGLSIASSIVAGDTVQLTLSNGAVITVLGASTFSYEIGGNPLTGAAGTINDYDEFATDVLGATVPAEGEDPVDGGPATIPADTPPVDTTAPEFSSAAADGTSVVLTYDEDLDSNSIPAAGDFDVLVGGNAATVSDVSVSGSEVTLTLDAAVKSTDALTVAYTQPASNRVQDSAGNDAETLAATDVTNNTQLTFELTASATTGTEGADVIYTVTASEELASDTDVVFTVSPGDATAADQGTNTTNLNDFSTGTFNPATVTISAGSTEGTFGVSASDDGITELPESFTVTAEVNGETLETTTNVNDGTAGGGQTFTLTTATDNIPGTSNDDTIIGELGGLATVNASDQIDGGAGTDIFKIFGTAANASAVTGNITNTETLFIDNSGDADQDFSVFTKAATGIERIELNNVTAMGTAGARTITTTADQTLSLATGPSNGPIGGNSIIWAAPGSATSLDLELNGFQGVGTPLPLTITGALATTQNIYSGGSSNAVSTLTLGAVTDKVVVTGDENLTVTTDVVSSGGATILKTIDAVGSSGGANFNLAATTNAAFAFMGGSGDDSITFVDNNMGILASGSQLDGGAGTADKIGIFDTVLSATEVTAINAATNFEVLGLNADITIDGSAFTSVKSFAIDSAGLTDVISNMATGAIVTMNASSVAQTYSSAVGVNDLTVDIGSGANAAITATALTIGQTAVSLSSNGAQGVTNVITTLVNADNSVYTITGDAGLTITNATEAVATGTKFDASAANGALTIIGNDTAFAAGSGLGDIIIGGSAADNITSSVNGATMTGNGGNDTFNVSVALGGVDTTALLPTITDFTIGDIITFGATAGAFTATAVDLSGAATEAAALNTLAAGASLDLKWGVYNGNTYIVDDADAGATFAATDTGVKLTGTLDLSTSTLAGFDLTFA